MRKVLLALLVVLIASCSAQSTNDGSAGAPAQIELTVDRANYRTGDPIVLTLRNRSAQSVGYNLCGAALEQRSGGQWRESPERLAEVCTMELRTLATNASDTFRHTLPAALAAGEYRVRTNVEAPLGGSFTAATSGSFQVSR